MRNLGRQWKELPFEKKLGTVVVPLVIASITGVVVPIVSKDGGGSTRSPERKAKLEVIDVAVAGSESGGQALDVTVRNTGDLVALITRIRLRVRASGFLKICQAGGGLPPSEKYDIQLIPEPQPGRLVEGKLSQEIQPNQADRFVVRLDIPEPERQLGVYLQQLDALLYEKRGSQPFRLGRVLVSVPHLPDPGFFWSGVPSNLRDSYESPASLPVKKCLQSNDATYRRMIALDGERSLELTSDPTDLAE